MKLTIQLEIDTRKNPALIDRVKNHIESHNIDNWLELAFAKALGIDFMVVNVREVTVDENDNYIAENWWK